LLPSKKLEPYYKKVTWLFVSRNFKMDARDVVALRSHDRFGISSWPQMFVFDGRDDLVLQEMPRDLESFIVGLDRSIAAYDKRKLRSQTSAADLARQRELADRRTVTLESLLAARTKGTKPATKDLDRAERDLLDDHADIVVKLRALRLIAGLRPKTILEHAPAWLTIANDPWRYELLNALARNAKPTPALTQELVRLFEQAGKTVPSRNPNVLRIRVAECLGRVGDSDALAALRPVALAASPRNGLTHIVIRSVAAIAARSEGEPRQQALEILSQSLPPSIAVADSPPTKATQQATRRALAVLRTTLKALGLLVDGAQLPAIPAAWTQEDRSSMKRSLHELVKTK
jgi:hypothetical protein